MYMYICIVVHVHVSVKNQVHASSTYLYTTDALFVEITLSSVYHEIAVTV